MKAYETCDDATCPVCGNREGNRDYGSYEPDPLDEKLGGTPDPCVHLIVCGSCRKCFDVAPAEYVDRRLSEMFPELAAIPDDLRGLA